MTEEAHTGDDGTKLDTLDTMVDGFNNHDLDAIMSLFADEYVFESPRGPRSVRSRFTGQAQVRVCFAGGSYFDA